ncbi:MAG: DUF2065 domain-containing protein [Mariprofundaceae bacterium]|nr:DUF2065 domain-containing protein [Mariprofundaceae bacterium]
MDDLWVAIGLVLVLEGAMYALFPTAMMDMLRKIPDMPAASLRVMGLSCLAIGWLIVWLVRS